MSCVRPTVAVLVPCASSVTHARTQAGAHTPNETQQRNVRPTDTQPQRPGLRTVNDVPNARFLLTVWTPVVLRNHLARIADEVTTGVLASRAHLLPGLIGQAVIPDRVFRRQTPEAWVRNGTGILRKVRCTPAAKEHKSKEHVTRTMNCSRHCWTCPIVSRRQTRAIMHDG